MYNKKNRILCYALTLLPALVGLFLLRKPSAGGYGIPTGVLWMSVVMALALWLCFFMTDKLEKDRKKNRKINSVVIWLIPALSNFTFWVTYALLYKGMTLSMVRVMGWMFGLLYLVLGNYLPKCRPNNVVGFRVKWTASSEANWSATHRLAGPCYVVSGLLMVLGSFLPETAAEVSFVALLVVSNAVPLVYSYCFYKKELRLGVELSRKEPSKASQIARWMVVFALVLLAVFLFTGSVKVHYGEDALEVKTSYYGRAVLPYDEIESIELRQENVDGTRTWGLGSFRLLAGYFENREFGPYVRFTYYNPHSAIVVKTTTGQTLVLSGKNPKETEEIYGEILERMPQKEN